MNRLKLFVLLSALGLFIFACGQSASTTNTPANTAASNAKTANNATPAPAATPEVATGAKLYSDSCSKCHKEDGSGGKVTVDGKTIDPDNLTSAKIAAKSDEKMMGYISDGFPDDGMPAFKDKLKPEEIKLIVAFIRSDLQKNAPKPAPTAAK